MTATPPSPKTCSRFIATSLLRRRRLRVKNRCQKLGTPKNQASTIVRRGNRSERKLSRKLTMAVASAVDAAAAAHLQKPKFADRNSIAPVTRSGELQPQKQCAMRCVPLRSLHRYPLNTPHIIAQHNRAGRNDDDSCTIDVAASAIKNLFVYINCNRNR